MTQTEQFTVLSACRARERGHSTSKSFRYSYGSSKNREHDCCDAHRPNDVRIDCKAAKHSEETAARRLAHLEADLRAACRPSSVDCSSGPLGPRANKRRFVNLLQRLGGAFQLRLAFLFYRFEFSYRFEIFGAAGRSLGGDKSIKIYKAIFCAE